MTLLKQINLALAILAVLGPITHLLELPEKFLLDGPLWLAIQQHLYRGWGPFIGAPIELLVLLTTLVLLVHRRHDRKTRHLSAIAAVAYTGMIAVFFIFNQPVNANLSVWNAATLPSDWPHYRLRWESGHALAALLAIIALIAIIRAFLVEHDRAIIIRHDQGIVERNLR